MPDTTLENIVIALLRKGEYIHLGSEYAIPLFAVSNYRPGQLYRVIRFIDSSRTLILQEEGRATEDAYKSSFDRYGQLLKTYQINQIIIEKARLHGHLDMYQADTNSSFSQQNQSRTNKFTETITFDIRKAKFDNGTISFTAKVKFTQENVDIIIPNVSIKKYFDVIKNYIWKLFGSKKTPCKITFEIKNGKCSPDSIDECSMLHINEDILEKIKDEYIINNNSEDIISLDKLAEQLQDAEQTDQSIFERVVRESSTKHYHHLRYLSARQAIDIGKLSITGKPLSFVFLIREKEQLFLVWETYQTDEATYMWKLSDSDQIPDKYQLILLLRKNKKRAYRNKKEAGSYFIEHNYQLPLNGFTTWRNELEKIIKEV